MTRIIRDRMIRAGEAELNRASGGRSAIDRWSAVWEVFLAELGTVIGEGGVRALYRRSFHVVQPGFPALAAVQYPGSGQSALQHLRETLRHLPDADCGDINHALLVQFTDLLAGLIGESLTVRLMHAAWGGDLPPANRQDITP